jgi:hypothetical protein
MAAGMLLNSHFPHATKITKPVLWVTGDSDQFHSVQQSQVLLYGLCLEALLLLPESSIAQTRCNRRDYMREHFRSTGPDTNC